MFRNWIGFANLWTGYIMNTGWLTESWRTTSKVSWSRAIPLTFQPNSHLVNLEFHLQRFIISNNAITSNNVINPPDAPTRLLLIDPNGNEMTLYNTGVKSFLDLNNYNTNRYLRFTEGAYTPCE